MENKQLTIQVKLRPIITKSQIKKIRKNNFVPGVVYGSKQKNITLSLDIRDIEKYSKREFENKIFTLQSEDKNLNGLKVIKKAVSYHPTKRKPIHIDFLSLDMSVRLKVNVEIRFEGKPKGVREQGGVFNTISRNVEIECLPKDIPQFISVDTTDLELNQNLHVSDLAIPSDLKLITKETQTICAVVEIKEEEVAASTTPEASQETEEATASSTETAAATTDKKSANESEKKTTESKKKPTESK